MNHSNHHTEQFGEDRLIVRRGHPFSITLLLSPDSKEFKCQNDLLFVSIFVSPGPLPRKDSDTMVSFSLSESTVDSEWSASANNQAGNRISVSINSSPDAPIGIYSLTVAQEMQKTFLGHFILLFNAWCPRDGVFMDSERKRQEYVLAQHGQVYRGTFKRIKGLPWNFGQFDTGILDICLKILDNNPKFVSDADRDCSARKNPIYVTRVLSAMINSNNDRGVLVGEWGDFTGGAHPGSWIGSGDILRKWAESGPVRYGQCWVFAAVACTVSRALGIPCRVVTNFGSAHDTDANLLIENFYDEDGERMSGGDSVWNFHVWVDSWMTRPDMGEEFSGWQTSDPTPQETSEGIFCCGPASVKAIREGELTKKYDVPFIFAEVNADIVDLVRLSNGEFIKFSGSTTSVGRFISTKAVGTDERRDITHHYKYPEGSTEERQVFEKAKHHNKLQQRGEDPNSNIQWNISFLERHLSLKLEYDSYGGVITSDRLIQLSMILHVCDGTVSDCNVTLVIWKCCDSWLIMCLSSSVQLLGEAKVDQPVTAHLTLLNSLPEPLQNCSFTIEGLGLTDGKPIGLKVGTVGPKEEAKADIEFRPSSAGPSMLLVNFDSNKLKNIKSFINIFVQQ
uniref:Protein-glutamine gamma-glutamyltransferase 2 n=1 Tax=Gouania willdenowi TaxID=441366 RepID=A0A8C5GCG5_GOUWI